MSKRPFALLGVLAIGLVSLAAGVRSAPEIGKPAPALTLPDTKGVQHSLAKYRGKWVVLEWSNYGCPYVKKHYRTGNIPGQQKKWREQGVVWLSVVSSAPGEQGYYEAADMDAESKRIGSNATAVLLDPAGTVGRAYNAMTTPHMFVIDPKGNLVYMGGIDDVPSPRDGDLSRAKQLADAALTEAIAGKPVSTPTSRPYGCNVKYR
jgi:alkyl hydroperoxide reductase subunit AhpC